MEFVHLTAGGRQMLEEFLADLEEMQKAKTRLHAGRAESEPALSRQLRARGSSCGHAQLDTAALRFG